MIKLLFFGRLQDVTQKSTDEISLPIDVRTTEELRAYIDASWDLNGLLDSNAVRVALNGEIAHEPKIISGGDEVAFMPPVGGG